MLVGASTVGANGYWYFFFFFLRNKSFLEILSSCDYKTYKTMLLSRKSRLKFLCFETLSVRVSSILPFLSHHAMLLSILWQDKNGFEGDLHSQGGLLGHVIVFLPSQCWCELTAINNIGRTRRRARTEITVLGGSVSTIYVQDCRFQEAWIKFRGSDRDCQLKIQTLLIRSFRWTY